MKNCECQNHPVLLHCAFKQMKRISCSHFSLNRIRFFRQILQFSVFFTHLIWIKSVLRSRPYRFISSRCSFYTQFAFCAEHENEQLDFCLRILQWNYLWAEHLKMPLLQMTSIFRSHLLSVTNAKADIILSDFIGQTKNAINFVGIFLVVYVWRIAGNNFSFCMVGFSVAFSFITA